jgi:hypothetical protein
MTMASDAREIAICIDMGMTGSGMALLKWIINAVL